MYQPTMMLLLKIRSWSKVDACLTSSDEIIQLFMLTDALKRQYVNSRFELTLGYIPYGRQDRVCNEGESLSIKVFAGYDKLPKLLSGDYY